MPSGGVFLYQLQSVAISLNLFGKFLQSEIRDMLGFGPSMIHQTYSEQICLKAIDNFLDKAQSLRIAADILQEDVKNFNAAGCPQARTARQQHFAEATHLLEECKKAYEHFKHLYFGPVEGNEMLKNGLFGALPSDHVKFEKTARQVIPTCFDILDHSFVFLEESIRFSSLPSSPLHLPSEAAEIASGIERFRDSARYSQRKIDILIELRNEASIRGFSDVAIDEIRTAVVLSYSHLFDMTNHYICTGLSDLGMLEFARSTGNSIVLSRYDAMEREASNAVQAIEKVYNDTIRKFSPLRPEAMRAHTANLACSLIRYDFAHPLPPSPGGR